MDYDTQARYASPADLVVIWRAEASETYNAGVRSELLHRVANELDRALAREQQEREDATTKPGPCPCECSGGGFCGGCGHAGCGGR